MANRISAVRAFNIVTLWKNTILMFSAGAANILLLEEKQRPMTRSYRHTSPFDSGHFGLSSSILMKIENVPETIKAEHEMYAENG